MVSLVCPQCRNKNEYQDDIDASKEIACTACGYSDVPTKFELGQRQESGKNQVEKILAIVLVGIGLLTGELLAGLILVAFLAPILIPVMLFVIFKRRKRISHESSAAI